MSDKIYFITDNSCEPIDPQSLGICSMDKSLYLERYGNTDWTFDSYEDAVDFCREEIQ
ncbi:hypothetical protein SFB54_06975 [Legionella pneumophila subsp. fraseri]|nr:hypothetical protein [Legionella pneumophila subsp. fraseri]HAT1796292.1 hypothetical protein [Legionella pneumophila]MDW8961435.1 hypothetical protein [Legionella pneumophila subsp. fraseri]MDW9036289.1 hypothetical protein [Legionella pneumophila subsp. fraseri]MDW9038954.1 hypothetical protein [Legionella pneumophila subsp. fraseri]